MNTTTRSATETASHTVTSEDVRRPMAMLTLEVSTILGAAADVTRDFDPDAALVDCSLLALNDVISAVRLQFYSGDELVREYAYIIAAGPLEAAGPPPEQPPLGPILDGARVRLTVTPNPRQPQEARDGWFRRLGWRDAAPLRPPAGAAYRTYGTFASGGYGLSRQLLVNPKFDRPADLAAAPLTQKESRL